MSVIWKNRFYRIFLILITIIIMTITGIHISGIIIEQNIRYVPDYDQVDLTPILMKDEFTKEDYKTLFYQTGLGPWAIDELRNDPSVTIDDIIQFQTDFFTEKPYVSERNDFTTAQYFMDDEGLRLNGFNLAPYDNGFVFVTDTSYTVGWRHGHAAIVVDKQKGRTLEAFTKGSNSSTHSASSWRRRPTFVMLRLKDAPQEELDQIAAFAYEHLDGLPYHLMTGFLTPKNPKPNEIKGTHCSHLVWYPFMQHGYDIDSDGSWLVTPNDIMNSDLFEVVQIYGFNPDDFWQD